MIGVLLENGRFYVLKHPNDSLHQWVVRKEEVQFPENTDILACAKDPYTYQLNLFLVKTDK